jgi:hypothetical protein
MTGFIDEPDGVHGDEARSGGEVEREQPPGDRRDANPREEERELPRERERPRTNDERVDEASEDSFPASDPPQQP